MLKTLKTQCGQDPVTSSRCSQQSCLGVFSLCYTTCFDPIRNMLGSPQRLPLFVSLVQRGRTVGLWVEPEKPCLLSGVTRRRILHRSPSRTAAHQRTYTTDFATPPSPTPHANLVALCCYSAASSLEVDQHFGARSAAAVREASRSVHFRRRRRVSRSSHHPAG